MELVRVSMVVRWGARSFDYDLDGWHLGMIATGAARRGPSSSWPRMDRRLLSVKQGERSAWA